MIRRATKPIIAGSVSFTEGVGAAFEPKKREVSLKYLRKKWADFYAMGKPALDNLSDFVIKFQAGVDPNDLKFGQHLPVTGEWRRQHKHLDDLLKQVESEGVTIGQIVKSKKGSKSFYLFYEVTDGEEDDEKIYLLALDPTHQMS